MPEAHEVEGLILVEWGDDPQSTKLFNAFLPILNGGVDITSEPISVDRPSRGFCLGIPGTLLTLKLTGKLEQERERGPLKCYRSKSEEVLHSEKFEIASSRTGFRKILN